MDDKAMLNFSESLLTTCGAKVIDRTHQTITVQLTEDLDKALMNRPFYWHYIEKTNGIKQPKTLTLTTDTEAKADAHLHQGSPRLHQLFRYAKSQGAWTCLYDQAPAGKQPEPLEPWLNVNVTISKFNGLREDTPLSIGLHLISGARVEGFMDNVTERSFSLAPSAYTYPVRPLITPTAALRRIELFITETLSHKPKGWAEEAIIKKEAELSLLDQFFQDTPDDPTYQNERRAIEERLQPKISVQVINGGLFYLPKSILHHFQA
ncbi:uncharacterized protein YqhG [Salsuginibacillus halophilus]|uniref:Uncharacterized protein YqhG n=1 Tax=Salsuginibacillus halophilus TaxID=517424 RepID=A0A2P8H834_9BACI|nr:YqhG family protein [Salsuginibacillus halophilus]PSL42350.1 uncharacterized protein YqhG [Salsuginibacillus halophilus]